MGKSGGELAARIRFWWADQQVFFGLVVAALFAAAVCFVVLFPLGPTEVVTGTIEGFGLDETDTGSYAIANVRISGRVIAVTLPRSAACSIGNTVGLQKQKRLWGTAVALDLAGCNRGH